MMTVRKAVIPAAGFGTRFLPATKSQPKEMLPIVDAPTIQYVVEEAAAAGITDVLMVIGKSKRAIEEHFYRNFELEYELREQGKLALLEEVDRISHLANIHFVWQKELNGLGDAIRYGASYASGEPFAVLLGDTLVGTKNKERNITRQLIDVFEKYQASVVALEEVPHDKVNRYGIVGGDLIEPDLIKVNQLVEKPPVEEAPSNLAIAGRYVFTPEIFTEIERTPRGRNNEVQLTDAMASLLSSQSMYGLKFDGKRVDIGNKLDFLKTNIEFGLQRDDVGPGLRRFIKEIAKDL